MLHWFKKTLISEDSAAWLHECSAWLLDRFDNESFLHNTPLVTPDNHYFPKQVSSPLEMAAYILERVTTLAGVAHLPWQMVSPNALKPPLLLELDTTKRHVSGTPTTLTQQPLTITYLPEQTKKPQDMVANIAAACSQHLLWQSQQTPPGGPEFFMPTAELLAVYLGFGVVLVNSAYNFRGSCAKCYDPRATRQASLTEAETVYALALFGYQKKLTANDVVKHIKPHLRNDYKLALKQIRLRTETTP